MNVNLLTLVADVDKDKLRHLARLVATRGQTVGTPVVDEANSDVPVGMCKTASHTCMIH